MFKLFLVFLLTLPVGNLSFAFVSSCSSLANDCEYYLCLETQKNCGERGYLKSFGYKYCQKFSNQPDHFFSSQTRRWVNNTKECLINSIETSQVDLDCKSFKKLAFKQHKKCYISSGYCSLPVKEKFKVLKVIGFELLKPRAIFTGIPVIRACLVNQRTSLNP